MKFLQNTNNKLANTVAPGFTAGLVLSDSQLKHQLFQQSHPLSPLSLQQGMPVWQSVLHSKNTRR